MDRLINKPILALKSQINPQRKYEIHIRNNSKQLIPRAALGKYIQLCKPSSQGDILRLDGL